MERNRVDLDLFAIANNENSYNWQVLRDGVDICYLYQTDDGPSAALLRYAPCAKVPNHLHQGFEHIFVLHGSQADQNGEYAPGTLVINAPGTSHSVFSPNGCIVLAIWERPVAFEQHA